ncbi:TRAP transporter small permease [bacterium]|nr:TRAP transporter small permease [bacterium]
MISFFKKVGQTFLGFCAGINALASFAIFLVLIFVCSDVIGRIFFNSPIMGTSEVVKVGVVFLVFMQIPWGFWENRQIKSDLITARLSPKKQIVATVVRYLFVLFAAICIFAANWKPMLKAWRILEYEGEGALHVPVYPLFSMIQLSSALVAILAVYQLIINVRELFQPPKED